MIEVVQAPAYLKTRRQQMANNIIDIYDQVHCSDKWHYIMASMKELVQI